MINALGNYIGYGEGLKPVLTQGNAILVDITGSNYAYILATYISGSDIGNQSFGSFLFPKQKQVQYFIVAGGGGGGFYGGGGGGGGYCTGSALIPANITVTTTVGRGGTGAGANLVPSDPTGQDGFNSIFFSWN
jgi:hypothetical protein